MASVDKKITVDVPVRVTYNQWTQFEEFPRFMEGVKSVEQLGDSRLHWVAEIGGERKEWTAGITRQVPDNVIAWVSEGGRKNDGTVIFHPVEENRTEVELHLEYEPEDMKEKVGDWLGVVSRRVEGDLKRFKEFVETRGVETGGWRGEIQHGEGVGTGSEMGSGRAGGMPGSTGDLPADTGRGMRTGPMGSETRPSGTGTPGYGSDTAPRGSSI